MNIAPGSKLKSALAVLTIAVFIVAALALGFLVVKNTASFVNPPDPPENIPINDCHCPGSR
jgi:uncharacterized protein YneF (UPF0154 family)